MGPTVSKVKARLGVFGRRLDLLDRVKAEALSDELENQNLIKVLQTDFALVVKKFQTFKKTLPIPKITVSYKLS